MSITRKWSHGKAVSYGMLTQIKIFGFQRHKRIVINIDEPILCITGRTDSGKSSIIRALRFVLLNKSPATFLHNGSDSAVVKLKIDGHSIIRKKGQENVYLLDGQEYKAFATDVPDAIAQLVNIDATSIQSQHDASYWLSLPAGQVSRELNNIVNLNEIDGCLSSVASELRAAKAAVQVTESRLTSARERKKELAYVPVIDEDLKEIEQAYTTWQETAQESSRIDDALSKLGEYQKTHQNAAAAAVDALSLCSAFEDMQETADDLKRLQSLIEKHQKAFRTLQSEPPSIDNLSQAIEDLNKTQTRLDRLTKLIEEHRRWEAKRTTVENELKCLGETLSKSLKGRCPICGGTLPKTLLLS